MRASLPIWERGLKFLKKVGYFCIYMVAPYMVAPYMGAWIEIVGRVYITNEMLVAPYMGAWIEICSLIGLFFMYSSRSLYGSVD